MPLYFQFKMSFGFFLTTREEGAVHAGKGGGMGHVTVLQVFAKLTDHFNTVDQ
jgi:hypothetical protein